MAVLEQYEHIRGTDWGRHAILFNDSYCLHGGLHSNAVKNAATGIGMFVRPSLLRKVLPISKVIVL